MAKISIAKRILLDNQIQELANQVAWYYVDTDFDLEYDPIDPVSMKPSLYVQIINYLASKCTDAEVDKYILDATGLDDEDDEYYEKYNSTDTPYNLRQCVKACVVALRDNHEVDFPDWKSVMGYDHYELRDEMENDVVTYCKSLGIYFIMDIYDKINEWSSACPESYLEHYDYSRSDKIAAAYLYLCSQNIIVDGIMKNNLAMTEDDMELNMKMLLAIHQNHTITNNFDEYAKKSKLEDSWDEYPFQTKVQRVFHYCLQHNLIEDIA